MKKMICITAAAVLAMGMMTGCTGEKKEETVLETAQTAAQTAEETAPETTAQEADASVEEDTEKTEILVAAAASLKNAYEEELIPMFEEENPGITVTGTYDSSGKLQTQIEEGLEADVFMSAATKQMKALQEKGMIAEDTVTELLENKIVLIVPSGSAGELKIFEDIEKQSRLLWEIRPAYRQDSMHWKLLRALESGIEFRIR